MKTVAAVDDDGFREVLKWDEAGDQFTLTRTFVAMGQSTDERITESEARKLLERWGQSNMLDDDFRVVEVDEYLTDLIMEGEEWHPLKTTP